MAAGASLGVRPPRLGWRRGSGVPAGGRGRAIAAAWVLVLAAQAAGAASLLHHDALIETGPPPWIALALFLVAWQVMIAAMMLPSSLPLVRLFAAASARQPRPRAAMAGFLGGYALVWSAFGGLAFLLDVGVHAAVDSSPWLDRHDWLIGGSVLALAGAFQFTTLKDACLDRCRHPGHFLLRFYERGAGGGFRLGRPPRGVLPRLLLGADAGDVLGRGGQPGMDGGADRSHGLREDAARRRPLRAGHGRIAAGRRGARTRGERLNLQPRLLQVQLALDAAHDLARDLPLVSQQEDHQHQVGLELDLRNAGHVAQWHRPSTSTIGYGMSSTFAITLNIGIVTQRPRIRSSVSCMGQRLHRVFWPLVRVIERPQMMVFFSNRLGCGGSILVSVIGTLVLLLVLGVFD